MSETDPGTPIYDELFNLLHPPLPPTKAYIEMMTSTEAPWRQPFRYAPATANGWQEQPITRPKESDA